MVVQYHSSSSRTISFFGDYAFGYQDLEFDISLSDYNVANFEGVLDGSAFYPAFKVGPHLSVDSSAINLGRLDGFAFGLANNHALDYRWEGLNHSIRELQSRGISTFGAGEGPATARSPLRIPIDSKMLSVIGASDNFFFQVSDGRAGIAAVEESGNWVDDLILSEIALGNYPIVYFHGGIEDWLLPSLQLKSLFERWIRRGAHAVIAHHPHLPLITDYVDSKPIFYGLGNFVVDVQKWSGYHPLALLSKRVVVGIAKGSLTFSEQVLQLSATDGVARVSAATPKDMELLTALEDRVRRIAGDLELHQRCEALIGMLYMENFWRKRLRLGLVGTPFRNALSAMAYRSSEGSIPYKLVQAFGPHDIDVYSPLASRRLASLGSVIRNYTFEGHDKALLAGLFGGAFHPI